MSLFLLVYSKEQAVYMNELEQVVVYSGNTDTSTGNTDIGEGHDPNYLCLKTCKIKDIGYGT